MAAGFTASAIAHPERTLHDLDPSLTWRSQRLVAELDGRTYHESAFEEDRERDATLVTAVRVTWRRLTHQEREAARIRALLAA